MCVRHPPPARAGSIGTIWVDDPVRFIAPHLEVLGGGPRAGICDHSPTACPRHCWFLVRFGRGSRVGFADRAATPQAPLTLATDRPIYGEGSRPGARHLGAGNHHSSQLNCRPDPLVLMGCWRRQRRLFPNAAIAASRMPAAPTSGAPPTNPMAAKTRSRTVRVSPTRISLLGDINCRSLRGRHCVGYPDGRSLSRRARRPGARRPGVLVDLVLVDLVLSSDLVLVDLAKQPRASSQRPVASDCPAADRREGRRPRRRRAPERASPSAQRVSAV